MKKLEFLLLVVLLVGCSPSDAAIQTAIAKTQNAPSATIKPTNIINQINATITVNATPTDKYSAAATQWKEAENNNATAMAPYITETPYITNTPIPYYTSGPTLISRLITATAVQATKQYVAEFKTIPWKELKGYPDNHTDEKIKIGGRVMQTIQGEDMLLYYPGTYDIYYATFDQSYTGIYENNSITLYGTVGGSYCYDTVAGGTNCVPIIYVEWYTK